LTGFSKDFTAKLELLFDTPLIRFKAFY